MTPHLKDGFWACDFCNHHPARRRMIMVKHEENYHKKKGKYYPLIEKLAELEHCQWMEWSKNIAETEKISPDRQERWKKLWKPYEQLTEEEKDHDREWACWAIQIFDNHDKRRTKKRDKP